MTECPTYAVSAHKWWIADEGIRTGPGLALPLETLEASETVGWPLRARLAACFVLTQRPIVDIWATCIAKLLCRSSFSRPEKPAGTRRRPASQPRSVAVFSSVSEQSLFLPDIDRICRQRLDLPAERHRLVHEAHNRTGEQVRFGMIQVQLEELDLADVPDATNESPQTMAWSRSNGSSLATVKSQSDKAWPSRRRVNSCRRRTNNAGQLIPKDTNERLAYARRIVAQRCLYGVDKNPLAAEMAKLSLWLLTVAKDKPFTFLDHAIRCGDSLVGIRDIRQVQFFQLDLDHADRSLFAGPVMSLVDEAVSLRRKIESLPANTVEDVREKERLLGAADEKTARLRYAADLLVAVEFQPASSGREKDDLHNSLAIQVAHYVNDGTLGEFKHAAKQALNGQPTFHWPLEFPEVMLDRGGFDAFVCNPPFVGGRRIRGTLGHAYLSWLTLVLYPGSSANSDLCAFFFRRAGELLREAGGFGFLATNTIAQGDTRLSSLDVLASKDFQTVRAVPSQIWPGTANVFFAMVWIRRGGWNGGYTLNDRVVSAIGSFLTEPVLTSGDPYPLVANRDKSFQGSVLCGIGFVIEPDEALSLIKANRKNREVLFPFLNGQDLNNRPDQSPSRWVINFFDWPLDRSSAPNGYDGPVAADFPECLSLIAERVRPDRTRTKRLFNGDEVFALRKPLPQRWWLYADKRPALYSTVASMDRVLTVAATSKTLAFAFCPTGIVFSHATYVFTFSDPEYLALMQSCIHESWARHYASSMKEDLRYTPTDCFVNFPFPMQLSSARRIGAVYGDHRAHCMRQREEGLTRIYARFHNPDESSPDIQGLRDLHVEMDVAVGAAYGWSDLDLGRDFRETTQGARFTISESARREVHVRLLKLNHERYAEQVEQGLHSKAGGGRLAGGGKKTGGWGRKAKHSPATSNFLDEDDPDPADGADGGGAPVADHAPTRPPRADLRVQQPSAVEPSARATPIDQFETDAVMAAFRQASRGLWLAGS